MKFSLSEIAVMQKLYANDKYPTPEVNHSLATLFNKSRPVDDGKLCQLKPKMLAGWFRSRRRKDAKTNKEGLSAPIPQDQLAKLQQQLHIGRIKAKKLPKEVKCESVEAALPFFQPVSQKLSRSTTSTYEQAESQLIKPLPQVSDR